MIAEKEATVSRWFPWQWFGIKYLFANKKFPKKNKCRSLGTGPDEYYQEDIL